MRKGCPLIQACRIKTNTRPLSAASQRITSIRLHDLPCIVIDPVAPIAERKHVVEFDHHGERIELARGSRHPIGLLVIRPITEIADPELGEELRGMRGLRRILDRASLWDASPLLSRPRQSSERCNAAPHLHSSGW